jgi:hypothetical protein
MRGGPSSTAAAFEAAIKDIELAWFKQFSKWYT